MENNNNNSEELLGKMWLKTPHGQEAQSQSNLLWDMGFQHLAFAVQGVGFSAFISHMEMIAENCAGDGW